MAKLGLINKVMNLEGRKILKNGVKETEEKWDSSLPEINNKYNNHLTRH